jgi:hypothetical protein
MISVLKKALWLFVVACGSASAALAQSTYFEVASTPYDHQMQRIQPALTTSSAYGIYGPSLSVVNQWMIEFRKTSRRRFAYSRMGGMANQDRHAAA